MAVCLAPLVGRIAWTSSLGFLLILYGSAAVGFTSWLDRLSAKIQRSATAVNILLLLSALLVTLAFIELSTRGLEGIGLLEDRRFARRRSTPMIDIRKAFSGRQDLFSDECHFTLEGHQEMAAVVVAALSRQRLLP